MLLGAFASCVTAACVGTSSPEEPTTARLPRQTTPRRWEHFAEARDWPKVVEGRAARGHSAGDYLIDVRVAPAFYAEFRGLTAGNALSAGTLIAAFHRNRVTGAAGSIYAMSKGAFGAWEYVVAAPDGLIEARGGLPLCVRCHVEAPADSVFSPGLAPARAAESAPAPPR